VGNVRVDKFLQLSRLVKRRAVAQELAQAGRVWQNGRPAKPGSQVRPGDVLTLQFHARELTVRVLAIPSSRSPTEGPWVEVLEDRRM
jgi:ribosomal 50S subunit-recycling heat shock protein